MTTITGTAGNDDIRGTWDADSITGGAGSDTIRGGMGNDWIHGGGGNDWLYGGGHSDWVDGGGGDDVLIVNAGDGHNTLVGGVGNDSITVWALGPMGFQLAEIDGGDGDDVISVGIAEAIVPEYTVTATGGAGQDTYRFISGRGAAGLTITDFAAGLGGDRIELWALLEFSAGIGFGSGNPFSAENGFLRLVQSGADTLLEYERDGHGGSWIGWQTIVTLRNVDASTLTAENFLGVAPDGSPVPGQALTGTAERDVLQGGYFDDTLSGGASRDTLRGSAGNDSIDGGDERAGGDSMEGGSGNDTLSGGAGDDFIDAGQGSDIVDGGSGNDWLRVLARGGDDTVIGGNGDDRIDVGPLDFIGPYVVQPDAEYGDAAVQHGGLESVESVEATGGAGQDTYRFLVRGLVVTDFAVGAGGDRIDLGVLLEYSGAQPDGYEGGNPFAGEQAILRLVQDGADTWLQFDTFGPGANGWYPVLLLRNVEAGSLTADNFLGISPDGAPIAGLVISGTEFEDLLTGGLGADTLRGGAGGDTLSGAAGNDSLDGGRGTDSVEGGVGLDTLDGGKGRDTLAGGAGDDAYRVDLATDVVIETADAGLDLAVSTATSYTLAANVEDGAIAAAGVASLTGNELANVLYAGAGDNVMDGASGTDTVSYAHAAAGVTVTLSLTTAQATGASGVDVLRGFENLAGSGFDDHLRGSDGVNRLEGAAGADTLAGGGGSDVLAGGAGNDVFDFDAVGDSTVREARRDTILDFGINSDADRIDLSGIDARMRTAADDAFTFIGTTAFSTINATGQLRYDYNVARNIGVLYGSTDADAEAEFAIELPGVPALAGVDLIL